jgi:DNA-binding MarR family transcriptional regulator
MAGQDGADGRAQSITDPTSLDFESFTRFAQERAQELAPEIDLGAMAFVLCLHRAASTVVYDIESTVHRPAGWSWAGFRLLFVLWLAGPLEAKHAARLSGLSRQSTSILANTLERDGLLERIPLPHDGRLVAYGLTPVGVQAISSTYAEHNRREQLWASVLEPEELAIVTRALGKILAAAPHLDVRRHHD